MISLFVFALIGEDLWASLCSSAFTTLPEILLITIDCLIYWQRIKLPRWRSLLYEGYSYHLDVYRLLISIYYLHQIATLLALASNRQRGDDWHILCPSSASLKHSMDAPRKWGHPIKLHQPIATLRWRSTQSFLSFLHLFIILTTSSSSTSIY